MTEENKPKEIVYSRIIYRPSEIREGWLESCITFISSSRGSEYRIYLDLQNCKYYIKNMNGEFLISMPEELKIKNKNIIYKHAKDHLAKLGVKFEREWRNRTFGLCEKGYTQEKHKDKKESPNQ